MNTFVDSFASPYVRVHFDTGNIMLFQHPEHSIPILGKRIGNTHFKEFSKKGTDHSLESFRPLLDGTTNWPAVMEALQGIGHRGYCTFEYSTRMRTIRRRSSISIRLARPAARAQGLSARAREH